ncbi:MAG: hypothetical protein K8F31_11500 [Roseovarius sp.]|nr:hypothetical protein [Roseovarius sp.]
MFFTFIFSSLCRRHARNRDDAPGSGEEPEPRQLGTKMRLHQTERDPIVTKKIQSGKKTLEIHHIFMLSVEIGDIWFLWVRLRS